MTAEPLITDMDRFFAEEWQQLADDISRDPVISPQMEAERHRALQNAEEYRTKLEGVRRCS